MRPTLYLVVCVAAKKSSLKGNSNLKGSDNGNTDAAGSPFTLSFPWWVLPLAAIATLLLFLLCYAYRYSRNHQMPKGKWHGYSAAANFKLRFEHSDKST